MKQEKLTVLKKELKEELIQNILPYWMNLQDTQQGGYWGRVDYQETVYPSAIKGAVMMCRILWTFSSAYRVLGDEEYLKHADHAKRFILSRMIDREYGGIYWSVTHDGKPCDTKKQSYAQGFAIYALSEYARATNDREALIEAMQLFEGLERNAYDALNGGYVEALSREWNPLSDMRLSDKDANEAKTMNTHLHILEPYANLLKASGNSEVRSSLQRLLHLFMDRIVSDRHDRCDLFFDMAWNCKSRLISFGHDIEAFWLLYDAATLLGEESLYLDRFKRLAIRSRLGIDPDGSMIYEKEPADGPEDRERHWWVQAENVVGNYYLYRFYQDPNALDVVFLNWEYIKCNIFDPKGEWIWSRSDRGVINSVADKAGFWKCPYHNSRMCLEIIEKEES